MTIRSPKTELQRTLDAIAASRGFDRVDLDSVPPTRAESARPPHLPYSDRVPAPTRAQRLVRARERKQERARERAERAAASDRRWAEKHARELAAAGYDRDSAIAPATWRAGWAVMSDHAGHAAQREYERLPAALRGCVLRACAGRTFRNPRAREIVGTLAVLLRQSRLTRAQSRRRLVVEYLSIKTLGCVLHDSTSGRRPARSTLSHKAHRPGGDLRNGQIGVINALRAVGAMHRLQERQCADNPTCNQYWLLDPRSPFMNAAQREFVAALAMEGLTSIVPMTRGSPVQA